MAILKPDKTTTLGGVTVKEYLLTKHNPNHIDMPSVSMEGKIIGVTIHNTDWISVASGTTPAEQYTRATVNGNMNDVRVHYYCDNTCAWQNLPLTLSGWHAADGSGNGNRRTIAIECILSSLAQEESRSISENVTWGQRKRFADGKVSLPYSSFLGYRKGADGLPEIVPEEAKIVRYIYRRFIAGLTPYKIAAELTAQGVPTPTGKEKWASRTIKSILTNEKYKGDALLQKKFTVDFLTKKQKINEGEIPQYYVENSHPAIIDPLEFDMVQEEFLRRENAGKQYSSTSIFASKMICGDCGSYFGAKVWHSNSKYRRVIYQCNSKFKGEHFCTTPHLYESEIQQKFLNAFSRYFEQRDVIIRNCQFVLNQLKMQDEHNAELQAEFERINEKLKQYISSGGTDSDYSELNARYEEVVAQIDAEEQLAVERKGRIAKMQDILRVLKKSDSVLEAFDENIWTALVETLTVFHDGSMVFLFKDGTEVKI